MKVVMLGRSGAFPEAGQATTGFLIQTKDETVLVDCGSGIMERMQRFVPVEELDAVFISHYHHDHVADLGVLQYGTMITMRQGRRSKPLLAYLPTADSESFRRFRFDPWFATTGISAKSVIQTEGLRVTFLKTRHPIPCLAMRFESEGKVVSFSGDSSWIPELAPFVKGSDLFICETNFFAHEDGSTTHHLTSREVGQIATEAAVKRVVMTHLPAYANHEALREEVVNVYSGPVDLSETGLTIEV